MKNLAKNYIYNLVYQLIFVISPLITMPFLSRSLGAAGVGQYSYAYSLTCYFTILATLGCDIYGRREISYLKEQKKERTIKFWSIELIKIISTLIVLIIYVIFSLNNDNRTLLLILIFHLINVPLNIGWFYQGIEQFKSITIRGIFLKLTELLFVLAFIKTPNDLNLYVFGMSFISFITFLVLWIGLKKELVKVSKKDIKIKSDLKDCLILFLPAIATSVYTLLDKTMIGVITENYLENGYYEQAQKINIVLLKIVLALGLVLMPKIAFSFKKNEHNEVKKYISISLRYVYLIATPIAFGLICLSDLFVPWFFGEDFLEVTKLLKISGFILIFQGIEDVLGVQYLVNVNRQREYITSLFIGALVNFILNLLLIPKLHAFGALIASLLGQILIVTIQFLLVKKEFNIFDMIKLSKNYVISSSLMLITLLLSNNLSSNIINTFIIFVIASTIYIVALIILKDEMVIKIKNTLIKKLKHTN